MSDKLININTASEEELVELPGIAKGLAARIVQYREKVHPFEEVEDLAAVPGISERMVTQLTDFIAVSTNGSSQETAAVVEAATLASSNGVVEDVPLMEVDVEADLPVLDDAIETDDADIEEAEAMVSDAADDLDEAIDAIPEVVQVAADSADTAAEPAVSEQTAPSPAFAPAPAPAPAREGIDWLAAFLGALLGLALAMIIGYFAFLQPMQQEQADLMQSIETGSERVNQIEGVVNSRIDTLNADVGSLATDSDARFGALNSEISTINTEYDAILDSIEAINGQIVEAEAALTSLEETTVALSEVDAELMAADQVLGEQITELNEVTAVFDGFLVNLRDLLVDIKGPSDAEEADSIEDSNNSEDAATVIEATPNPEATPTPIIVVVPKTED